MDELPSTEFRKRFARLTTPTVVTVNGHPLGQWIPVGYALTVSVVGDTVSIDPPPMKDQVVRFNSRPFTPVPKGK